MNEEIKKYNDRQATDDKTICNLLALTIDKELTEAESKIWHAHPVWFLAGNPIVGYGRQKAGLRLMFWSGTDFEEEHLNVRGKKFKDASVFFTAVEQINTKELKRWLKKIKNHSVGLQKHSKKKRTVRKVEIN